VEARPFCLQRQIGGTVLKHDPVARPAEKDLIQFIRGLHDCAHDEDTTSVLVVRHTDCARIEFIEQLLRFWLSDGTEL